ncbi:MAG: GGDEF domain-containing protein [Erysipelothrix sp.]|jgi:diguanylate cyclase (GGDEF)-like protein|nr:GGDEF domain-containing protein [Erysipelothrix sp.]
MDDQIFKNVFLYICDKEGHIKTVVNSIIENQTIEIDEKIYDRVLPDGEALWNSHIINSKREDNVHWKGFLTCLGEEPYACYFARLSENQIMVLGMKNEIQRYLYEEMLKINGKLTNKVRGLYKEKTIIKENEYEEISKMNNELSNARRELVKNNYKLEELNQKLEQLTIKDFLTDLYNRRHFYSFSRDVANRAKRLGYACCLIMIDINGFKSTNDNFGHDVGDSLLVHLSMCMKNTFRHGQDTIFRFGGDEFLVLLEASNYNDSLAAMKRLNQLYEQDSKGTSLAAGIVEIKHDEIQENFDEFIKKADELMYLEKKNARD